MFGNASTLQSKPNWPIHRSTQPGFAMDPAGLVGFAGEDLRAHKSYGFIYVIWGLIWDGSALCMLDLAMHLVASCIGIFQMLIGDTEHHWTLVFNFASGNCCMTSNMQLKLLMKSTKASSFPACLLPFWSMLAALLAYLWGSSPSPNSPSTTETGFLWRLDAQP